MYGQVSVTSYSIDAFGINTNQDKKVSFELKTFVNRFSDELSFTDELSFEFTGFYNFKLQTYHKFALGAGLNVHPSYGVEAVTIPFNIEILPLQDFKRLSLIFELAPEYYVDLEDFRLRSLWGLRYRFGNR